MEPKTAKGKILIVDDTPSVLDLLKSTLETEGHQVFVATNGEKALKRALLVKPDLILLDVLMPGWDGFKTCRRLKMEEAIQGIPVIFMTALTQTEYIVRGFKSGAVDYITKPFNQNELLARVNTHLHLKFSQDTILQQYNEITLQRNELNEILHVLCHDIANPIQAIMTTLQLLERKPDKLSKFLDLLISMTSQSIKLLHLVRSLRALAEGKTKLDLISLNLKKSLNHSIEILQNQFSKKQITPILNVDEDINVIAEETSLVNSVFNNILTNAIKFSHPSSTIIISAKNEDSVVNLSIRDSGIGMPQTLLEKVFMLDQITTRLGTQNEKGFGFGMQLMKKFVMAYGGGIEVFSIDESESSEKHGTEVVLTFKSN